MSVKGAPNVLLITTDQQRYDTLGVTGGVPRTPHLDGLAKEGTVFYRSYVNNPVCMPSRACIQTGRYTHQHGLRYMESEIETTPGLPPWEETFMERLQIAGYNTCAVGKIHMMPPKGFDELHLTHGKGARWTVPYGAKFGPSQLGNEYAHWLEERHPGGYAKIYEQRRLPEYKEQRTAIVNVLPTEEYIDTWVTEQAQDYIRRQSQDKPFLLWYGLCNPHGPVDPPLEYAHLYPEADIQLSERYTKAAEKKASEDVLRRYISYYYGLCTYVDDMVGRVFTTLREQGLWDNTLIIFTTDHGEMMGDHGLFGKGCFYEGAIHAPLLIKPPVGHTYQSTVNDLVEHIDLAPTILDYVCLPAPAYMEGKSLKPVIEGDAAGKEAILCEWTTNNQTRHEKCLRTERYKYIYSAPSGAVELYDLQNDPDEWRNLAYDPGYVNVRIEMHDRLMRKLLTSEKPIVKPRISAV
jgi:arylsulfatase